MYKYRRYGCPQLSFNGLSLDFGHCECAYSTWAKILILRAKVCIFGNICSSNHRTLGVGESLCIVSKRFASCVSEQDRIQG